MAKRGSNMKIVTIERGREVKGEEADRLRLEAMVAVTVNQLLNQRPRYTDAPDRASVRRAMIKVESRIVQAMWTLSRLPDPDNRFNGSGGWPQYIQDPNDRFANAVANGGKWDDIRPRPPLPSSRAIDAMDEPLDWLKLLPSTQARIVAVAAGTKRGDVFRNVSWSRVRDALPQARGHTIRTLQRRYDEGVRAITSHLTGVS